MIFHTIVISYLPAHGIFDEFSYRVAYVRQMWEKPPVNLTVSLLRFAVLCPTHHCYFGELLFAVLTRDSCRVRDRLRRLPRST